MGLLRATARGGRVAVMQVVVCIAHLPEVFRRRVHLGRSANIETTKAHNKMFSFVKTFKVKTERKLVSAPSAPKTQSSSGTLPKAKRSPFSALTSLGRRTASRPLETPRPHKALVQLSGRVSLDGFAKKKRESVSGDIQDDWAVVNLPIRDLPAPQGLADDYETDSVTSTILGPERSSAVPVEQEEDVLPSSASCSSVATISAAASSSTVSLPIPSVSAASAPIPAPVQAPLPSVDAPIEPLPLDELERAIAELDLQLAALSGSVGLDTFSVVPSPSLPDYEANAALAEIDACFGELDDVLAGLLDVAAQLEQVDAIAAPVSAQMEQQHQLAVAPVTISPSPVHAIDFSNTVPSIEKPTSPHNWRDIPQWVSLDAPKPKTSKTKTTMTTRSRAAPAPRRRVLVSKDTNILRGIPRTSALALPTKSQHTHTRTRPALPRTTNMIFPGPGRPCACLHDTPEDKHQRANVRSRETRKGAGNLKENVLPVQRHCTR
ncbi:hypothetical protein MKEN_00536900 [Mycena kentingensis (nom. inval.)]|nr:hypothetical protein MKEN_00536900 [Mycena kentingensis (nom. inval.)]